MRRPLWALFARAAAVAIGLHSYGQCYSEHMPATQAQSMQTKRASTLQTYRMQKGARLGTTSRIASDNRSDNQIAEDGGFA